MEGGGNDSTRTGGLVFLEQIFKNNAIRVTAREKSSTPFRGTLALFLFGDKNLKKKVAPSLIFNLVLISNGAILLFWEDFFLLLSYSHLQDGTKFY